jgi:glycosyltransferase involved in cell wall biosynthesis
MEVPVVATRTGGVPEIIEDNVTGLLVEVRNPHALAEGILRLIREPALCQQFAKAGRERVLTRFTTQQMVRGTVAVYEQVLAEHRRVGEVLT